MEVVLDLRHNEQSFIEACVLKEKWAQRKLYEDNYPVMMSLCLRYASTREDASDILHDGFIKVFLNIAKYSPGTSLNAWIKRIMINTAIDYYRKQVRRRTDDISTAFSVKSLDPDITVMMSVHEILNCLQELSPAYRAVFNLFIVDGYSHREIASKLLITESTSRSNLVKARKKLQKILITKQIVNDR